MWDCHEFGECRPSQESIVRSLKISDLKLYSLRAEIILSLVGYGKRDMTNGGSYCTRDHSKDLDNSIWSKVFRNRMFRELPPLARTRFELDILDPGANYERIPPRLWHKVWVVAVIEGNGDLRPFKVLRGGG
jgi:hypothetical protein